MLNHVDNRPLPADGLGREQLRGTLQQLMNQRCGGHAAEVGAAVHPTAFDCELPGQSPIDQFLSRMSHEVRLPLSNLLGCANWLRELAEGRPDLREAVDAMQECGEQLSTLMDDIAEFARIESGEFYLSPSPTDIRRLLEETAQLVAATASSRGLTLTTQVEEAVPLMVEVDACRVRQIVLNLVVNAVRFTDRGGIALQAEVTTDANQEWLEIRVEDTGRGISAERLRSIFTPFPKLKDAAEGGRKYGGLGLAVNYRLAKLLGGRIEVESQPG
ncbi:MAG: HAMP domain-containing sensor histidine kinase, partial [Pirellulales bacterium]